jgi:ligand-binding sensor domain-containing protein
MINNLKRVLFFIIIFATLILACSNHRQQTVSVVEKPRYGAINTTIRSIYEDSKGHFWFGSDDQGVFYDDGDSLRHFTTKDGLCNQQIRTIQEDKKGNIYFETGNGIARFDGKKFTAFSQGLKHQFDVILEGEWQKQTDDLWFGGAKTGVYRYDGETLHYLKFPHLALADAYYKKYTGTSIRPYDIYSSYRDTKGNLWFGTQNLGVCCFDGKKLTWISENGLSNSPIRSIFEDKNGIYWFGGSGPGLYRYDGKTVSNYTEEKGLVTHKNLKWETVVSVTAINADANDELWFATFEAGLWRYDGARIIKYDAKNGLPSNTVAAIFKDKKGKLWFGTNQGVYGFDGAQFYKK